MRMNSLGLFVSLVQLSLARSVQSRHRISRHHIYLFSFPASVIPTIHVYMNNMNVFHLVSSLLYKELAPSINSAVRIIFLSIEICLREIHWF